MVTSARLLRRSRAGSRRRDLRQRGKSTARNDDPVPVEHLQTAAQLDALLDASKREKAAEID